MSQDEEEPVDPQALGLPVRRRRGRELGLRVWKKGAAGGSAGGEWDCLCLRGGAGGLAVGDGGTLVDLTLDGLVFQGQWGAGALLPSCV